jgi:S-phase kinase-associated protein 1
MAAYGEKGAAAVAEKEVTGEKTITLISDGQERKRFEVSEAAAARLSSVLGGMIYGGSTAGGIPLPIGDATLATVAEYLNRHDETDDDEYGYIASFEGPEKLGDELVNRLGEDEEALFNLIDATNFLCIIRLLDAACKKVADMMKGKTPKQICTIFNIPDDYTKEEKKELRREYAWPSSPSTHHPLLPLTRTRTGTGTRSETRTKAGTRTWSTRMRTMSARRRRRSGSLRR